MKRKLWIFALCTLAFAQAFAQQKEPPATTIKRRAELVLVPAVVTQDGKPVAGLTAKDFVLLHNGHAESVDVFEEIDATPAKVAPVAMPPRTVRNYATADSRQDVVILLLDYLNSSWSTRARIHSYLGDMMRQFTAAQTTVSIFFLSRDGLLQMQSFTSDLATLAKAIDRWQTGKIDMSPTAPRWESPFTPVQDAQTDRVFSEIERYRDLLGDATVRRAEITADAIEQISEAYRGIPGRKKLIWMSTGFPLATEDVFADVTSNRLVVEAKVQDRVVRAWRSLSSANVVVYTIDSNGVANPSWERSFSPQVSGEGRVKTNPRTGPPPKPMSVESTSNSASLLAVAEQTGGRSCTQAPNKCVGEALSDGTHYYILGFYLHGENKPGWHKLKVDVNGNGAKPAVRARNGFVIGPAPDAKKDSDKEEVMNALAAPLDYTGIPLRLSWSTLPGQGKETLLELALFSPPGGIAVNPDDSSINIDYLAFIRPVGKTEGRTFPASLSSKLGPAELDMFTKAGFRFRKQVPIAPGRYELRVFLRDNVARNTGTVSTIVDLTSPGTPALGAQKP